MIEIISQWPVGRRRTFRLGGHEVTLTVTAFDVSATVLGLAMGRLERVTAVGSDVRWADGHVTRVGLVGHDVQFTVDVLGRTTVSTGPLDVEATVADRQLQAWLRDRLPHRLLVFSIGADAVPRVSLRRLTGFGCVELDAEAVPDGIRLRPAAIAVGRWRIPVRRLPSLTVRPLLPAGLTITAVEPGSSEIKVGGVLPSYEIVLTPPVISDLIKQAQNGLGFIELTGRFSPS